VKRILFAAAIVQSVSLIRPLSGAVMYFGSRASLERQRQAVIAVLAQEVA
jgi:hypothetical protein